MKRIIYRIGIVCIPITIILSVVSLGYFMKTSNLYEKYRYPNEDFYGKELYSEISYRCSEYEEEIGNMIVNRGIEVLEYKGDCQEAEKDIQDVGELDRYYYFDSKDAISQEGTIRFITCKITGDEGHVWVVYTLKRYDGMGKVVNSSTDILSLLYIEKEENTWCVSRVSEAP